MTTPGLAPTPQQLEQVVTRVHQLLAKLGTVAGDGVEHFIQGARNLLGDRPKLAETINIWQNVAGNINTSQEHLGAVQKNFAFWTGSAKDASEAWVKKADTNLTDWKTQLGRGSGLIAALHKAEDAVVTFLTGIIAALGKLASDLGRAVEAASVDPVADIGAAVGATSAFLTTATELFNTALNSINTADQAGDNVFGVGKTLSPVTPPGGGVTTLGLKPAPSVI